MSDMWRRLGFFSQEINIVLRKILLICMICFNIHENEKLNLIRAFVTWGFWFSFF